MLIWIKSRYTAAVIAALRPENIIGYVPLASSGKLLNLLVV
jgi:hypothetical protein